MIKESIFKSKLTHKFLERKVLKDRYGSHSGNVTLISDRVAKFIIHNLLPGEDGQLDGHYTFFVNVDTFDYLIYQSSYYGSLTYTTESRDTKWVKNLNKREKQAVEHFIACKLLGAYFYNYDAPNSDGYNLVDDPWYLKTWVPLNPFSNGPKSCLIADYRRYVWCDVKANTRDEKEEEAIKLLEPEYKLIKVETVKIGKIKNRKKTTYSYQFNEKKKPVEFSGYCYELPVTIITKTNEELQYSLYREVAPFGNSQLFLADEQGNKVVDYTLSLKRVSQFTNNLPQIIEAL